MGFNVQSNSIAIYANQTIRANRHHIFARMNIPFVNAIVHEKLVGYPHLEAGNIRTQNFGGKIIEELKLL